MLRPLWVVPSSARTKEPRRQSTFFNEKGWAVEYIGAEECLEYVNSVVVGSGMAVTRELTDDDLYAVNQIRLPSLFSYLSGLDNADDIVCTLV